MLVVVVAAAAANAGMIGKLYVKRTEVLLTDRAGVVCRDAADMYCERNYECPPGRVAHAMLYNFREEKGRKQLSGIALVCADPNAFSNPEYVGPAGAGYTGEVINDYCPVGYMLAGAKFATSDRHDMTGVRRVCRRYRPYEERIGPNLYGEGLDAMTAACPEKHWVTGVKVSFERKTDGSGKVDDTMINARFYCSEVRHWLVEPTKEELDKLYE
jgi:hypothetical protein